MEERQVVIAGRAEAGLAFRHPLVRLTCYDGLSAVRRRQLHGAYAQAVQRRRPDAVDALASHFTRADDPRAADYLRRAAERAAALYANDTADRYYRDLVARLDVDAARARLAHSRVLRRMGEPGRAAEVLRAALAEFRARGDHDDTVTAAAHLSEAHCRIGELTAAAKVLDAHPPNGRTGPEARAVHHLARSGLDKMRGRYPDAYAAARRAQEPAEHVPGPTGQLLQARSHAMQAINLGLALPLRRSPPGRMTARSPPPRPTANPPCSAPSSPPCARTPADTADCTTPSGSADRPSTTPGGPATRWPPPSNSSTSPNSTSCWRRTTPPPSTPRPPSPPPTGTTPGHCPTPSPSSPGSCCAPATAPARPPCWSGPATPGDQQADHEVRRARALYALRGDDPDGALAVLGDAAAQAPELAAHAHLAAGRPTEAARIAAAEAARAHATGERLAETEALIAHATAATRLGDRAAARTALARADHLARTLPYPSGLTRVLGLHAELGAE